MRKLIVTLFLLLPLSILYSQDTIHVPGDYTTIQSAINAANNGDIVLVADGTYLENINYKGKAITVASHFLVDGDYSHIQNTTIDGSQPSNPDSGSVVAFGQGEDTTTVLCGFRITGGSGTLAYNYMCGGGIFIEHTSPMIMNNIIEDNIISTTYGAAGGGILADIILTPLIIKNNIIRNNIVKSSTTSAYGGGISVWSHLGSAPGEVMVMNNLIENNKVISPSFNVGGGISINGYDDPNFYAYVKSNKIVGNMVDTTILQSYAGGITLTNTHAYVENNIIAYNIAYEAAGIDNANLGGNSSTYYANNTLCYNYAVHEEGGISSFHLGQMVNCIVWGNEPDQFTPWSQVLTVTHSLIGEPYNGAGNIEGNPFFLDSVYFFMDFDSTLCIDAGNPDPIYNDVEDPLNPGNPMWPALGSLTNDIGHFGGANSQWCYWRWPMIYNPTSVENEVKLPTHFSLEQNYPNPFNPSTKIRYSVPQSSSIVIKVFDILGNEIETLVNEEKSLGTYELNWNAENLPSGVYFYQLQTPNFTQTKKMILLK